MIQHTGKLGPGTRNPGPILGTQDPEPIGETQDSRPLLGTWELRLSTWDPSWIIQTPILAIRHMKDYMERKNFNLSSNFWRWLLHVLNCVWKVLHKNVTFKREKLYEKVMIVAANVFARFRIVTHSYAASFLRKVVLCETNNICYSLGHCAWHKMNNIFYRFRNFAYLSSYLHLKSFAWKWDYVIS